MLTAQTLIVMTGVPFAAVGSVSPNPLGTIRIRIGAGQPIPEAGPPVPVSEIVRLVRRLTRIDAGRAQQLGREPFAVVQKRFQKVLRVELLVLFAERDGLRGLHESARTLGELFHIHERPLRRPARTPLRLVNAA